MANNQSTINLFCNKNLVKNGKIWKAKYNKIIETNGGNLIVNEQAYVEGFGIVCFSEKAMTYADLADRFRITYNNWIQDAFYVHK